MAITLLDNLQYYFNIEPDPLQPARYGFTVYYLSDNPYAGHKGIWPGEEGPPGCNMYYEAQSLATESDDYRYLFSYIAPALDSSMIIASENFNFTNFETYFHLLHTKEEFETWVSNNLFNGKAVKYFPMNSFVQNIEWGENQGVAILKPSVFDRTKITDNVKCIVISAQQRWGAQEYCPLGDRKDSRYTYSETKGPVFPAWNFSPKYESITNVSAQDTGREPKYYILYGLLTGALTFGVRFLSWKTPAANVYEYEDSQIAYTYTINLDSSFRWVPAPYQQDAHGPEWLAYVWPGTYKDDNPNIKQLCTKGELEPEHEGEWPEPEDGGPYSYPGHWDCCNLYTVGVDFDDYSLAYKSGVNRDQYNAVRRTWQTMGVMRDRKARYMPPSTSRDGGNEQDSSFGSDENTTIFGFERPNVMISQSGRYHDEAPTWDLHTGTYQELIEGDIQEVSLPRSYGAPLRYVEGSGYVKDWDAVLPMSWYTWYTHYTWVLTTSDHPTFENTLFVNTQEYPGPRLIEGQQTITDTDPDINAFRWPEEKPRESGRERQYKQKRLALTSFPWIPCVGAVEATSFATTRSGKLPLMEEQENVYVDGYEREEPNNLWPADRTVRYCNNVHVHGIKYDSTFFEGTAPATADSLHHAPDMSGEIAGSAWFNPSKVFGRDELDRQQAYLPPCGFNMSFIRADRRSSRVFYPTRKGYIKADYTSKSLSVLQEVDEYYMSIGECTLSYISPNRKAYTATYGTAGSPTTYNLTSSVYSSQAMVEAILQRLRIRSECKHSAEVTFPRKNFDISHISGVDSISIDLISETVSLNYKHI